MRINVVSLYVTDQDKAKSFYTERLGFKLKDDEPYGPNNRWLTVVSPEDEGTELCLAHEDSYPGAKAYREAMYAAERPAIGFAVADVRAIHKELSDKGVTFTRQPTAEEYGGHGASIDDGCGKFSTCIRAHDGVCFANRLIPGRRRAEVTPGAAGVRPLLPPVGQPAVGLVPSLWKPQHGLWANGRGSTFVSGGDLPATASMAGATAAAAQPV